MSYNNRHYPLSDKQRVYLKDNHNTVFFQVGYTVAKVLNSGYYDSFDRRLINGAIKKAI